MNARIFWVHAMKCTCAQTRPRFILSSEGVLEGMEFEPMLTPREKSPLPKMSPEEDRTRDTEDSEPKYYQLSYSGTRPQSDSRKLQRYVHDSPLEHFLALARIFSIKLVISTTNHSIFHHSRYSKTQTGYSPQQQPLFCSKSLIRSTIFPCTERRSTSIWYKSRKLVSSLVCFPSFCVPAISLEFTISG